MVDEVDIANDLIDNEVSRALGKIRQQTSTQISPLRSKNCLECGEKIPEARRHLGFKFCVSCAEEAERRKSLFAD